jgi:CHAT domain-containing protein
MKDERLRVTSFEEGSLAFEDMVRLQALHRGHWEEAFGYADRGRAISFRPSSAAIASQTPALADHSRELIPPGVVLLYYVALEDRLLIFGITRDHMKWADRPIGRGELVARTRRLRTLAALGDLDRLRPVLRQWHDDLVTPIASVLPPYATIAVIPDGPLNDVPFAGLLQPSGKFLIEDHPVVRAPSLAALIRASDAWPQRAASLRRALVVAPSATTDGNRTFPELPEARGEAATIARHYADSTVLTGRDATRDAFKSLVGDADVVHFAGHAVASLRYPMLSRLLFAAGDDASGALTAFDLETLSLGRTRVVTLAACEAGGGLSVRGEGTLSLARPWLRAGAASVIASIWEIDDTGARRLFTSLHELIASGTHPARALQHVQVTAAGDGRTAFRDWAGLAAFGAPPHSATRH